MTQDKLVRNQLPEG